MSEIEWNGDVVQEGNVININSKREKKHDNSSTPSEFKVRDYLNTHNKHLMSHRSNFFVRKPLKQGDDKMSDKNDDRYSEIKEDLRDSEKRISSDIKEREQRFERESVRREERFEKSLEKFAEDAKEREERYMNTVREIKQIMSDGEKNQKSTTIAVWTLSVTTLLGIAAMIVTVITNI